MCFCSLDKGRKKFTNNIQSINGRHSIGLGIPVTIHNSYTQYFAELEGTLHYLLFFVSFIFAILYMIDRSSMDSLVRLEYSILTIFTPRRGRLCLYDIKSNPCMIQLCIGQGERRRRFVLLDRSNSLARQIYPEKVFKKGRG